MGALVLLGVAVVVGGAGLVAMGPRPASSAGSRRPTSPARHTVAGPRPVQSGDRGPQVEMGDPLMGAGQGGAQGAVAGAAYGPIGAIVGGAIGAVLGLVDQVDSFGSQVRIGVREWLKKTGQNTSNGTVDAVLFRWALLYIGRVWLHEDGRVACRIAEVHRDQRRIGGTDLVWYGFDGHVSGVVRIQRAGLDVAESIRYGLDEIQDPAGRRVRSRDSYARFKRSARAGDLHVIGWASGGGPLCPTFPTPPHQPAYIVRCRPRLELAAIRDLAGWSEVQASEETVNTLAAGFDRRVGAVWQ